MALTKVPTHMLYSGAASEDLSIDSDTLFLDVSTNRVGVANNSPSVALDVTGEILSSSHIRVGGSNNELRFYEGANYVGFEAPALSADQIWVLPSADGSASQLLKTDGSGNLGWATDGSLTDEQLQDKVGAMFSSNTETGITATYQDADGTIDLVVGTLNQDTTGTAATVTTAAQTAITSVGTLTGLTGGTGDLIWDTPTFVVDSSANSVGIGTTAPATQLQLLNTGESMIRMGYSTTQYGQVGRNSDGTYEFSCYENGGVLKFGTSTTNNATTERMRIDSAGVVNIGTASGTQPSYFHSYLNVQNNASTSSNSSLTITAGSAGYAGLHFGDSDNGRIGQVAYNNSDNALLFTANNSERMRIDSSGRVMIPSAPSNLDGGENNSYALLRVQGNTYSTASDGRITLATGYKAYQLGAGDGIGAIYFADDSGGDWAAIKGEADGQGGGSGGSPNDADDYPGRIGFFTTPDGSTTLTERMRITSAGYISIPATASATSSAMIAHHTNNFFYIKGGSESLIMGTDNLYGSMQLASSTNNSSWNVNDGAAITINGSTRVCSGDFNDTSDVALKENITNITGGLSIIKQLQPRNFDWKEESKADGAAGFIAQEVATVLPNEVQGEDYSVGTKDEHGVREGNSVGKTIKLSGIVAHLTKAVQELEARIKTLEDA